MAAVTNQAEISTGRVEREGEFLLSPFEGKVTEVHLTGAKKKRKRRTLTQTICSEEVEKDEAQKNAQKRLSEMRAENMKKKAIKEKARNDWESEVPEILDEGTRSLKANLKKKAEKKLASARKTAMQVAFGASSMAMGFAGAFKTPMGENLTPSQATNTGTKPKKMLDVLAETLDQQQAPSNWLDRMRAQEDARIAANVARQNDYTSSLVEASFSQQPVPFTGGPSQEKPPVKAKKPAATATATSGTYERLLESDELARQLATSQEKQPIKAKKTAADEFAKHLTPEAMSQKKTDRKVNKLLRKMPPVELTLEGQQLFKDSLKEHNAQMNLRRIEQKVEEDNMLLKLDQMEVCQTRVTRSKKQKVKEKDA